MQNLDLAQRLLVQAHSPSTITDSSGLQSIGADKQNDISVFSGPSNRLSPPEARCGQCQCDLKRLLRHQSGIETQEEL
jgi:hypothetical protein